MTYAFHRKTETVEVEGTTQTVSVDYVTITHQHGTNVEKVSYVEAKHPERFALMKKAYEAWVEAEGADEKPVKMGLFKKRK